MSSIVKMVPTPIAVDELEYGISIHICVALMLFLILHQQAVVLVLLLY